MGERGVGGEEKEKECGRRVRGEESEEAKLVMRQSTMCLIFFWN